FPDNSSSISDVPAGIYEVMVMDVNSCQFIIEDIVLSEPEEPPILTVAKRDISCYNDDDGYINIDVTGCLMPYSIKWDFGSSATSFENLGPGIYTVTVTDALGCELIRPVAVEDAPVFEIEPEVLQISCFDENDGAIKLNL